MSIRRRRRRSITAVPLGAALAALLLAAAPAAAQTRVVTMKGGPYTVGAYQVSLSGGRDPVRAPNLDGYITHMEADVVDVRTGKPVPIKRIMLHHIVFVNFGSKTFPRREPFYGDGEERAKMSLPPGYGYRVRAGDRWAWVWMLMNHRNRVDKVYIRYRMTVVTGESRTAVIPEAWDTSFGNQALVFDVPGGGRPGSLSLRRLTRTMPVSGRLVAGLGHVHGGAKDLTLSEPACGDRTIYRSSPTWGLPSNAFYQVRPVLHEPGPINMSQFQSQQGIPVAAGQPVALTSRYDNQYPHTRAMGLLLAYLAPDPSVTPARMCGALPTDVKVLRTRTPGRTRAPVRPIRIYDWGADGRAVEVTGPRGPLTRYAGDASVNVADFAFNRGNLSVPLGATVRWAFNGSVLHNVTLANGPEGFSSNRLIGGATFAKRFTRPGTYSFFCELHPVGMIQRIVVRRGS